LFRSQLLSHRFCRPLLGGGVNPFTSTATTIVKRRKKQSGLTDLTHGGCFRVEKSARRARAGWPRLYLGLYFKLLYLGCCHDDS
jgi:hypothetical protein